jgi:hypothetical protein
VIIEQGRGIKRWDVIKKLAEVVPQLFELDLLAVVKDFAVCVFYAPLLIASPGG